MEHLQVQIRNLLQERESATLEARIQRDRIAALHAELARTRAERDAALADLARVTAERDRLLGTLGDVCRDKWASAHDGLTRGCLCRWCKARRLWNVGVDEAKRAAEAAMKEGM